MARAACSSRYPVASDTLLERLEWWNLAPLEIAEAELEKFKAILTQGEREYFRDYLVDRVKQGSSYTRISNRSFIEPELKGMNEADRYAAVWITFYDLSYNLNRDPSQ